MGYVFVKQYDVRLLQNIENNKYIKYNQQDMYFLSCVYFSNCLFFTRCIISTTVTTSGTEAQKSWVQTGSRWTGFCAFSFFKSRIYTAAIPAEKLSHTHTVFLLSYKPYPYINNKSIIMSSGVDMLALYVKLLKTGSIFTLICTCSCL